MSQSNKTQLLKPADQAVPEACRNEGIWVDFLSFNTRGGKAGREEVRQEKPTIAILSSNPHG